jgi:hypothetical protein
MIEKSEIIPEVNTTTETTNNENIIYNTCTCRIRNNFMTAIKGGGWGLNLYPYLQGFVSLRVEIQNPF